MDRTRYQNPNSLLHNYVHQKLGKAEYYATYIMANLAAIKLELGVKSLDTAWAVLKDDNKEEVIDVESGQPVMADWVSCGKMGKTTNQLYPKGIRVIAHSDVAAPLNGEAPAMVASTKLYLDLCTDSDEKEYLQIKMLSESTQVFTY
jgi:hypothetical protein